MRCQCIKAAIYIEKRTAGFSWSCMITFRRLSVPKHNQATKSNPYKQQNKKSKSAAGHFVLREFLQPLFYSSNTKKTRNFGGIYAFLLDCSLEI